jgi:exopolyphosphatase/guanosine-5'-triphosphate,3'-diphosphate pyrophosphatase
MALWMAPIAEAAAGLAGGGASSAATGRHLLRAATMLALASLGTEPNLRVEQATQWALRKRWIGLDAAGRAMIAAAVLANSGKVVLPDTLVRLAPAGALNEAQAWGLAMRLARRMTGGIGSALDAAALSVVGGELVLSLKLSHASLFTEATAKDLRVLAERLGLAPRYASVPNDTQFVA